MAQLSFEVPPEVQEEIQKMFAVAAKEVLAEVSRQELNSKPYMNLKESAEYIGCSFVTLRTWINERGLRTIKIGGKQFIAKSEIDRFMLDHQE